VYVIRMQKRKQLSFVSYLEVRHAGNCRTLNVTLTVHARARTHACTHARMHARTHARMHSRACAHHVRTRVHTHSHMHEQDDGEAAHVVTKEDGVRVQLSARMQIGPDQACTEESGGPRKIEEGSGHGVRNVTGKAISPQALEEGAEEARADAGHAGKNAAESKSPSNDRRTPDQVFRMLSGA